MERNWFVYANDIVSGPFTTTEVENNIALGRWSGNCFIWWKGQREWTPISQWAATSSSASHGLDSKKNPLWYLDSGNSSVGPLTQSEMLQNLRGISNLGKVRLWTEGLAKWMPLFEMHDIMDELGLSRREHDRAPLMGTVLVSRSHDDPTPITTHAASISIAGIGLNGAQNLIKGEDVQLIVRSSEFKVPIRIRGTVIYVTSKGAAGVRFSNAHPETQSLIFDYVKKFNLPTAGSQAA